MKRQANRLQKSTLLADESGKVVYKKDETTFSGWNDAKGTYYFRNKDRCIYLYPDIKFPEIMRHSDVGKLILLLPLVNPENNMFSVNVKKPVHYRKGIFEIHTMRAITQTEMRNHLNDSKHPFQSFWARCTKSGIIKRIKYNGKMFWTINPAYINVCKHIPFWLYDEFKSDLDKHLPAWVISNYNKILNISEE